MTFNRKILINSTLLALIFLGTGCSTISISNFQDGKPLGKGRVRLGIGSELSPMTNYGIAGADVNNPENFDTFIDSSDLADGQDSSYYFWGLYNLLVQYGVTDKIDIGVIPFVGAYGLNFGAKGFTKYAFMPEESAIQIAAVPYFGYSRFSVESDSPDEDFSPEWDSKLSQYNTIYYGLDIPISWKFLYASMKVYSKTLNGKFTYWDKDITHEPSLSNLSYGVAIGGDGFKTDGRDLGRTEIQIMYEKTPKDQWEPRIYVGWNKFFEFGGSKTDKEK